MAGDPPGEVAIVRGALAGLEELAETIRARLRGAAATASDATTEAVKKAEGGNAPPRTHGLARAVGKIAGED